MSELTYNNLANHLPADTVEYIGNQLKVNNTQLVDSELVPDSSLVEPTAKYLEGLVKLTEEVNETRKRDSNDPVIFASKRFMGMPGKPLIEYTVTIAINEETFINNLTDPTV
ncbi:MAG: hypothetical protein F6K31_31330 [Symploca sp. SIO2G7]|nr:hypothetical protein [Symploca sp. SIO2G7]